ncbi:pectate lyase [Mesorhizobium sp. B283B1A]|uniref:pectate lyase n=1 Tax=Mesorhizobium TaxID=68287 RepID=UPI001CD115B8|nr:MULTISPECIES: pectate lyase [Mesorhizobium]MCA0049711.1 pectate lyase [Mesorhizobium sp. B283B1A]UQS66842.1 pectate lyase [Mesorhizobium opportunistum]
MLRHIASALVVALSCGTALAGEPQPTIAEARGAIERAGAYFRDHLGVAGTYVWKYSLDGQRRMGEGGAVPTSVGWVQPPGTPAVGAAFLRIFEVTGDRRWLQSAQLVATALVKTQLESGGWFYSIETDPKKAATWCYRSLKTDGNACHDIKDNPHRNETVLDDNNTQSVLNFLMWFDWASGGSDPDVRSCIDKALHRLMRVQYPNGAFPVFFKGAAPGADVETAAKASIPASWSHEWQKPDSPPYFIVNDNLPRDMGRLFLNAYRTYGDPKYLQAAEKVGDFLLAAQLPAPQQGWAQEYDRSMQPVWGRKFEPPGVVSRETAGNIDYLIELNEQNKDARLLDAAESAAKWLLAARLPDGKWARFYELNTNRPVYIDDDNQVTFDDKNLLHHYGMKTGPEIEPVFARLELARRGLTVSRQQLWISGMDELSPGDLSSKVRQLIDSQDAQGRWVEGRFVMGQDFIDGVFALGRFISPQASAPGK